MISNKKYVNASKMEQPIIKSVGFNNEDVLITDNGEYEAKSPYTGFGKVIVDVPQATNVKGWIPRSIVNGKLELSAQAPDFTGVEDIGNNALRNAYYLDYMESTDVSGVITFPNLINITGEKACHQAFYFASGITGVDMSNLVSITGKSACVSMFRGCQNLTFALLGKLRNIEEGGCANMFEMSGLLNMHFDSLETIGEDGCYNMFDECTNFTEITFPKLKTVGVTALSWALTNTKITNLSFPSLLNVAEPDRWGYSPFHGMIYGVPDCTVHFPSNLQSVMWQWSDVINGFGGTNTVILFDLPSTEPTE